jgi:hypothetical protein
MFSTASIEKRSDDFRDHEWIDRRCSGGWFRVPAQDCQLSTPTLKLLNNWDANRNSNLQIHQWPMSPMHHAPGVRVGQYANASIAWKINSTILTLPKLATIMRWFQRSWSSRFTIQSEQLIWLFIFFRFSSYQVVFEGQWLALWNPEVISYSYLPNCPPNSAFSLFILHCRIYSLRAYAASSNHVNLRAGLMEIRNSLHYLTPSGMMSLLQFALFPLGVSARLGKLYMRGWLVSTEKTYESSARPSVSFFRTVPNDQVSASRDQEPWGP